jgi:hypothetical protein
MRKEIALALVVVALVGGFLLGRQFPAHHYQQFGTSRWAMDTATGRVCDPWGAPKPENLIDKGLAQDSNDPWKQESERLQGIQSANAHSPCSQ